MAKILSVDDSRVMRRMIQGTAEALGFGWLEAGNGAEAMHLLETEHADVALACLDINMPEVGGLELLARMKADERFRNIPVVMVTSESCRSCVVEAIKNGAANYVTKPFTQEELATKIVETLGLAV